MNVPASGSPTDGSVDVETIELFNVDESSVYVGPPLVTTGQIATTPSRPRRSSTSRSRRAKLADLAVTTGKLGDGAVSAAKMQANSILAKHLVLTDFENLCTNPSGDVGDTNAQIPAGWIAGQGSPANILLDTSNRGQPTGTNVFAQGDRDAYFGQWFPIAPGDQFWCSVDAKPDTASSVAQGHFTVGLQLADNPAGSNPAWQSIGTADKTINAFQSISGLR
jgi:hypothetical protein